METNRLEGRRSHPRGRRAARHHPKSRRGSDQSEGGTTERGGSRFLGPVAVVGDAFSVERVATSMSLADSTNETLRTLVEV